MKFTDLFVRRPVLALVVSMLILLLGALAVSKLPVRQSTFRRDRLTNLKVEEVTLFSKYRDVGQGVMWPYDIQRQRDGEKIFEIFSESVTINQDLKDELFTLPANLKILKPMK